MIGRKYFQSAIRALGRDDPPEQVVIGDQTYNRVSIFKHDFFAATALYQGQSGKIVAKFGRRIGFIGLPMGWIGRSLVRHEARLYELVDGVPGIPRFTGRCGKNGFAHEFIEGHELTKGEFVNDTFFDRLTDLIEKLHGKDIAYVDMEKRENILVGDDGNPYLIDFQISWHLRRRHGGATWPARIILRVLKDADSYHLLKHRRRQRPDLMTIKEIDASRRPPLSISWHRVLFRPLTRLRRKALEKIEGESK